MSTRRRSATELSSSDTWKKSKLVGAALLCRDAFNDQQGRKKNTKNTRTTPVQNVIQTKINPKGTEESK